MTKFKVGDKVRYLGTAGCAGWARDLVEGKTYKLREYPPGPIPVFSDEVGESVSISGYRSEHFELVADKPTKNQRLSAAEAEISELKARIEALEKAKSTRYDPVTTSNVMVGDKIRINDAETIGYADVTSGKVYEVVKVTSKREYRFVDDVGDLALIETCDFPYVSKVTTQAEPKYVPVTADNIEVDDKVRVNSTEGIVMGYRVTEGKTYEVVRLSRPHFLIRDDKGNDFAILESEFQRLEKVVSE